MALAMETANADAYYDDYLKPAKDKYLELAKQGDPDSQMSLAVKYINGSRVPHDQNQGIFWYLKAAEQGYVHALIRVAELYSYGVTGVPQNGKKAVALYRKAAEQGSSSGLAGLASMYSEGRGVPQNGKKAVALYRKAAEQGHVSSQTTLAGMYSKGKGVPQDQEQAFFWYQKAAEQGSNYAQYYLADMYYNGKGVSKNYILAHMWGNICAISDIGDYCEKARDRLAERMTGDQIAEAQAKAEKCFDSGYKEC